MRENKRKKEVEGGREKHDENAGDFIGTFFETSAHTLTIVQPQHFWLGGGGASLQ